MIVLGIPDFEPISDCCRRQAEMVRRLRKHEDYVAFSKKLVSCESDWCPNEVCLDACYFGARVRRLKEIQSGHKVLTKHRRPWVDISFLHPSWQREIGDLHSFNIAAARQQLYRRVNRLPGLIAIGSFEACLNTELDGSQHWALGVHAIAANVTKAELKTALNPSGTSTLPKGARPLVLNDVDNLGRQLAYALKNFVEERRAYVNPRNGRVQRRHIPPPSGLWAEHDAWLASLPSGARTIALGCQRRGGKFYPLNR